MERSRKGSAQGRTNRWRGILTTGTGASMAAVAAVLILGAPAALAGVTPNVTLTAPYKKATAVLTNPKSMTGCGSSSTVTAAYFNKTSGIGGFSSNASTTWCTSSTNNSAKVVGIVALTLPIPITTNGSHVIQATWITVAQGYINLTGGTCTPSNSSLYSGCTRASGAFVYGSAFLLDKTTHKKTPLSISWPGNFTYLSAYTSCIKTSCSTTGSGTGSKALHTGTSFWLWQWNATKLNRTHLYALKMYIFGGVSVVLMTSGGATLSGAKADAQFNSGTLGNDEQLYSVSIT